jgi:hypothetical protein
MKKILIVAGLASVMIFNTGCEPEEIAAGAIGVAIGVGIAAGSDHSEQRPNYPPPRPYPGHGSYDGPNYGGPRYDGPRYDGPRHDGPRYGGGYNSGHGGGYGGGYGSGYGGGSGYGSGYLCCKRQV